MAGLSKLVALTVEREQTPGRYGDGGGLYLQVSKGKAETAPVTKAWIFRYRVGAREREMGLGAFPTVSLKRARDKAGECRRLREAGLDPIEARDAEQARAEAASAPVMTFKECAEALIASKSEGWKNAKHQQQWTNTLATYAYPALGHLPPAKIDEALVLKVLQPIWTKIPETAGRVRGRIEAVLDYAKVLKQRTGENPAMWRGNLVHVLAKQSDFHEVRHHPALPYDQMGKFIPELRARSAIAALALEFLIFTVARSNEVLEMRWPEIDEPAKLWIIPKDRMKGDRGHRVPLSDPALAVLEKMKPLRQAVGYVFPGQKPGKPLSNTSMEMLIHRMNGKSAPPTWRDVNGEAIVPHGFRSSFKDWASECTSSANEISEMALAHAIDDKTEAAYRRGDLMAKRRLLMEEWAAYCVALSEGAA